MTSEVRFLTYSQYGAKIVGKKINFHLKLV